VVENERYDEVGLTPAERTREIQRMTIRIIELERDLPELYPGAAREAVLNEIDRCKYRLTRLLEDRETRKTGSHGGRTGRRSRSSKFYPMALLLLAVFLLTGAMIAAALTGVVILVHYFTSDPAEPVYAGDSSVVVKE
jgi:hypothetical protein